MTATRPSTRCWTAFSPRIRGIFGPFPAARAPSVARDGPRPGKVGLVIGGGSGHEPTFLGFVGKGLADAAAIGNVFASPPPDPILECAKAVSGGAGVLFMYGNYAGDVMNFDMAAEMAAMDDIEVRTVLTHRRRRFGAARPNGDKRRGVAGNFFIFKAAGAACDRMLSLDECERIARKANDHTFTMGVALSPCSLPQTRRPNFEIGDDEMEIGMGIHGEPGVARGPLKTADEVTDEMLDHILAGDGAVARRPRRRPRQFARLDAVDGALHHEPAPVSSGWPTSVSMSTPPGSATTAPRSRWPAPRSRLHQLDGELQTMLDHPCDCAMFRAG